jgi:fatty acid-binding protein DegV
LGTRITGVAIADDFEQALTLVADRVGNRAMGGPVNLEVLHADAAEAAGRLEKLLRERYTVAKLEVGELPATHGAQLGPGTVGVGMCPAKEVTNA